MPSPVRIDQLISGANNVLILPYNSVYTGVVTVASAGTAVVLGVSTAIKSITIKAVGTNAGLIYVGTSAVTSSNGFQLGAKDSISIDVSNLATIYINSQNNSEGISYIALS